MECTRRLKVQRGDTAAFELPVTLKGAPYNTAGSTFWMTGKHDYSEADGAAVFQIGSPTDITPIGPTADGLMSVKIPAAVTAAFVPETTITYDVQITTALGEVYTLEVGEIVVLPDYTNRLV